ncbi:MAG: autophagy- protein 2 [Ramalina farinacea]|uniref:Autophagy-related protein 2 n=1 Tax=Ramalina farinacea TaxID=258253 RepID=A0AA43TXR4_9LECA|nr:autophagy- protein 2 [Ramalina farinacea]
MAYFIPSFVQKRVLRYALSRLELLDTDAIDLENLDVTWGKRSTVELKDVGVHCKKLSALLQLPDTLNIAGARLNLLRLTIPADLHQSGISIEISGLKVHVEADCRTDKIRMEGGDPSFKSLQKVEDGHRRGTQSHVHDPGGQRLGYSDQEGLEVGSELPSDRLPSTEAIAESFLEREPDRNKEELQASFLQSQHLERPPIVEPNSEHIGIGNELSLPAFLADFLKGVIDRMHVQVRNIQVDLDIYLHVPSMGGDEGAGSSEKPESVVLRLAIEALTVSGAQEATAKNEQQGNDSTIESQTHNMRRIQLDRIQIMVISDAALFTQLARSPVPSSPNTVNSSTFGVAPGQDNSPLRFDDSRPKAFSPYSSDDQSKASIESSYMKNRPTDAHDSIVLQSSVHPLEMYNSADALLHHDYHIDHSSVGGSHIIQRSHQSQQQPRSPLETASLPDNLTASLSQSPPIHRSMAPPPTSNTFADSEDPDVGSASSSVGDSFTRMDDAQRSPSEDLTESKIYSHEEATSMYMSAMSQNPQASEERLPPMPGDWQSALSDNSHTGPSRFEHAPLASREISAAARPGITRAESDRIDTSLHPKQSPLAKPKVFDDRSSSPEVNHVQKDGAVQPRVISSETSQASDSGAASESHSLVKHIVAIENIDIQVSTRPTRPSSESTNLSEHASHRLLERDSLRPNLAADIQPKQSMLTVVAKLKKAQIVGDMTLTKMITLSAQSLSRLSDRQKPREEVGPAAKASKSMIDLSISFQAITWQFLDSVRDRAPKLPTLAALDAFQNDLSGNAIALLQSEVRGFQLQHRGQENDSHTEVKIGKLSFGYADADIITFNADLRMRDSTRDILAPVENDIVLTAKRSTTTSSLDIRTLAISVLLDLRKLDETFGWFGGLSSMLGLGSSMISTITPKDPSKRFKPPKKPMRGVHFEKKESEIPSEDASMSSRNKITARIGGLTFDVKGHQTTIRLTTSAVKIVSRPEGLGLQIDRLKAKGPLSQIDDPEPSMSLALLNLRVEYLSAPKEVDLARLIEIVLPSQLGNEDGFKDGLLVDTLLRQRRKGGVVRVTVDSFEGSLSNPAEAQSISSIVEDMKKLSSVARYLPEDDRPGVLTLVLLKTVSLHALVGDQMGMLNLSTKNAEIAHIGFPLLLAVGIRSVSCDRNGDESLIGTSLPSKTAHSGSLPLLLARFIGNEMDPTIRIRIHHLRLEYHVITLMDFLGIKEGASTEEVLSEVISSVATLRGHLQEKTKPAEVLHQDSSGSKHEDVTLPNLDIILNDTIVGLNPRNTKARGYVVFEQAQLNSSIMSDGTLEAAILVKKASALVIDEIHAKIPWEATDASADCVGILTDTGYVPVASLMALKATMKHVDVGATSSHAPEIEIDSGLLLLETCADSTETLMSIMNGLSPPRPKSTELKYRTQAVPVEEMLASFTGNAYAMSEQSLSDSTDFPLGLDEGDMVNDEVPQNLEYVSSFYDPNPAETSQMITDSMLEEDLDSMASPSLVREIGDRNLLESFDDQTQVAPGDVPLNFHHDHFGDEATNQTPLQELPGRPSVRGRPTPSNSLQARLRNFHIIWNLYDGYDWERTRQRISQAVNDVQSKANERSSKNEKGRSSDLQDDSEDVIGDFLFNSIYIGVPASGDAGDLARRVNEDVGDNVSETGSYQTSTTARSASRQGRDKQPRRRKLRLKRSQYHKMTFELKGISADFVVYPPGQRQTQSSIRLLVQDLEIFDHVPTSTWKKFATYMSDAGEREYDRSMVDILILDIRPIPELAASELAIKASILPLRLHVDQDALDFMTRFFEFKDDSLPDTGTTTEKPFLQRVEVNAIRVKLDFKPKRVDYAGLRSGHTTEFMNFFILDQAEMVLRHVIIYGVSGFDKLGKTLNDIWMPDIKQNQLPGILAGLGPLRGLVNVGQGVRDLVVVPIAEYKKDGRVVRSFQKGALAFAKTTTSEFAKLGAKLAIGTQTVLQGAETLLTAQELHGRGDISGGWDDAELDEEEKEQISLYSNQPVGVIQGLRGAYASLERDLLTAKDAIVAMPGEVMESGTAGGAAKAVLRGAPTVILRPAMGVSKAVGQTLMGATNSLDPGNRKRLEDKYKRH